MRFSADEVEQDEGEDEHLVRPDRVLALHVQVFLDGGEQAGGQQEVEQDAEPGEGGEPGICSPAARGAAGMRSAYGLTSNHEPE